MAKLFPARCAPPAKQLTYPTAFGASRRLSLYKAFRFERAIPSVAPRGLRAIANVRETSCSVSVV